jgi:hypothetical protein
MDSNPLKQYFRQPAIYIRLPSGGQFYPKGTLNMPANGELPVLPMTTMDEIRYRTPDALFNGTATVEVIQSCVPNILDAWAIPSVDIDTILIAIRIATFGHDLSIGTQCPSCATESDWSVDLRRVMENIKAPDYQSAFSINDLEIYLHPMTYHDINTNNMQQFQDQKALQALENPDTPDQQRGQILADMLVKITAITTQALAQNIAMVKTPQVMVTDQDHIREWLSNCDRSTFNAVRDRILSVKAESEIKPLHIKCTNCSKEYDQQFTLDMTTFFADAS